MNKLEFVDYLDKGSFLDIFDDIAEEVDWYFIREPVPTPWNQTVNT